MSPKGVKRECGPKKGLTRKLNPSLGVNRRADFLQNKTEAHTISGQHVRKHTPWDEGSAEPVFLEDEGSTQDGNVGFRKILSLSSQ